MKKFANTITYGAIRAKVYGKSVIEKIKNEEGLTVLEYILLGSLILIFAIFFYNTVKPGVSGASTRINDTLQAGSGQGAVSPP